MVVFAICMYKCIASTISHHRSRFHVIGIGTQLYYEVSQYYNEQIIWYSYPLFFVLFKKLGSFF